MQKALPPSIAFCFVYKNCGPRPFPAARAVLSASDQIRCKTVQIHRFDNAFQIHAFGTVLLG